MLRTETTNHPARIAQRRQMISINTALQVDLFSQANVSTVVPRLDGPVTSFQHSFIVSDQGQAAIWGHDASAQAEQIITHVAHPSARPELREAGRSLGFRV